MVIALDYDETYTADPDGWDAFIRHMFRRGHRIICVTRRHTPPQPPREREIPVLAVICAGNEFKRRAAERAGWQVDVWIDDMPGTIEEARILSWHDNTLPGRLLPAQPQQPQLSTTHESNENTR